MTEVGEGGGLVFNNNYINRTMGIVNFNNK